ncbi:adhesion G -coupled receptor E3-like protein [Labeo rohita]|uniref:Adhesion G-coupled receptor E3-like protein n=1 Tax=Labeo rohita TaxID=84645 RepID=A0A498M454_LABRO|nr:adhesion G -coupled receptor E3-like protein [Labeo rohita]
MASFQTVINLTLQEECTSQTSGGCFQNLLEQIENITAQVLPLNTVTNILTVAFNASEKTSESLSSTTPTELASYGNRMLKIGEKLISTLVKPTVTSDNVSFTLATVVVNITLQEECTSQTSGGCFQNLLEQIENITAQVLPLNTKDQQRSDNSQQVVGQTSVENLPASAKPTGKKGGRTAMNSRG